MSDLTIDITENTIKSGTGGIKLDPSANEVVTINEGILLPDGTKQSPAIRFTDDMNTGIYSPNNDVIALVTHGEESLRISGQAGAVNHLEISSSATGGAPSLSVLGGDTNIDLNISAKGTGDIVTTSSEVRFNVTSINNVFVNGVSVLTEGTNISRLNNDAGYLTNISTQSIQDLNDVASMSPNSGQVLTYNTLNGWQAEDLAGAVWGSINGTLSDQTDLQNILDGKANISHTHTMSDITDSTWISDISGESIEDLNNVDSTMTPSEGQVLTYQSGQWTSADATGGGGGSSPVYKEKEFHSIVVDQFAKGFTAPFQAFETDRCTLPTTAHCPTNDIIVNVYDRSAFDSVHTLTLFKVDKAAGSRTVISSENTTLVGDSARWVDISETGDRIAVAMIKSGGVDEVVILVTTDDWQTYSIEQTVQVAPSTDENVTSVALNGDGSAFFVALGNAGGSATGIGQVRRYVRSGSTWSFEEQAFTNTTGVAQEVTLFYGQQHDTSVGFLINNAGSDQTSYHLYQKSGTWSQVWTSTTESREKWAIPFISYDGQTILYKPAPFGSTVVTDALSGSPIETSTPEPALSATPYVMTGDGHNIVIPSNDNIAWVFHRDGTQLLEIGFQNVDVPWMQVGSYGGGYQETAMRPSKGNTHYYFHGSPWLVKSHDVLYAGVDHANWIPPFSGINYL